MDVTMQIGGKVVRSPYGVEVTWKKTMWTNDGDKTTRFFLTEKEQTACIERVKSGSKAKSIKRISG